MSKVPVGEAGIERRKKQSRALLNKLYAEGYRVIVLPNGSIRVGHADTGEVPDERLQNAIINFRHDLKGLCDPKVAEREDVWGKALRGSAQVLYEAGVEGLPESVHTEIEYAQQHWEQDDVGGARYHLMRAYAAAKRIAEGASEAA